ncbi:MAG: B3/B4 domain-containing protein [Candidatus Polarisedimenticolia bacterium]
MKDRFLIDDDLAAIVCTGLIEAAPVAVAPAAEPLLLEIETACAALAREHAGKAPAAIEGLRPSRDLYRAFGIDPTRTRPSSEALLRRVLQGKGMPRILNAVDLCNLCALRYLLSIGLYDAAAVRGAIRLRRGAPGEAYQGIRKDTVNLDGRPVLCDDDGPFGNPTSDSLRTSVTPATGSLLMVIFAPAAYGTERLERHVRDAADLMTRHLAPPGAAVVTRTALVP